MVAIFDVGPLPGNAPRFESDFFAMIGVSVHCALAVAAGGDFGDADDRGGAGRCHR
jgi:hypothetical protein